MREVKIALLTGLLLLLIAVVIAITRSPTSLAHTNQPPREEQQIAYTSESASFCQGQELVPRGTSAIRLSLFSFAGPRMRVAVLSGGRRITSGERGSGWTSRVVTVPVRPLAHAVGDATVCVSFALHDEGLTVYGQTTSPSVAAHFGREALAGRMRIEYLRPGTRTWASLIPAIVSHLTLGRASSGPGIALLAFALLIAVIVLASRLVLSELR